MYWINQTPFQTSKFKEAHLKIISVTLSTANFNVKVFKPPKHVLWHEKIYTYICGPANERLEGGPHIHFRSISTCSLTLFHMVLLSNTNDLTNSPSLFMLLLKYTYCYCYIVFNTGLLTSWLYKPLKSLSYPKLKMWHSLSLDPPPSVLTILSTTLVETYGGNKTLS